MYATMYTRPDAAYEVGMLCRAVSRPSVDLYDAAIRVLVYLSLDTGRWGYATHLTTTATHAVTQTQIGLFDVQPLVGFIC